MRRYPVVVCFRVTEEQNDVLAQFLKIYSQHAGSRAQRFREALEAWDRDQLPASMR
jgi:hypothetical protein